MIDTAFSRCHRCWALAVSDFSFRGTQSAGLCFGAVCFRDISHGHLGAVVDASAGVPQISGRDVPTTMDSWCCFDVCLSFDAYAGSVQVMRLALGSLK